MTRGEQPELPPPIEGEMAHLSADERRLLGAYWTRRARAEREVGAAFAYLASSLDAAEPVVLELLRRGASDEERHGLLCEQLAARYSGGPVEALPPRPLRLPRFKGCKRAAEATVQLAGLCAVGESVAVAWLQACVQEARSPLPRAAAGLHLREEVGHARAGWAHLASRRVGPETKAQIGSSLPRLFELVVIPWWAPDPDLPDEGAPAEGIPSLASTRAAVKLAIGEVVLPGLAHVGVPTGEGERWWQRFLGP